MRYLYTTLFYLILPAIMLRLLWRALRLPDYARRWGERLGFFHYDGRSKRCPYTIWVHAVSLGETLAATPLIKSLQKKYPDTAFVITTMTPTGSKQVRTTFKDSAFHVYAPYDIPGPIQRFSQLGRKGTIRRFHNRDTDYNNFNFNFTQSSAQNTQRIVTQDLQHLAKSDLWSVFAKSL